MSLPAWFNHPEESFFYKEVQFRAVNRENHTPLPQNCVSHPVTFISREKTELNQAQESVKHLLNKTLYFNDTELSRERTCFSAMS